MAKVIVVDDDSVVADLVAEIVEFCGHSALVLTESMQAVQSVQDPEVRAIFCDYMMPKLNGLDVLMAFEDARPDVRRIMITAAPEEAKVREFVKKGTIQLLLEKPPRIPDVKLALAWLPKT